MLYRKLNIFYTLLISAITLISCNTPQGVLNSVEDDVYFSRNAPNNGKPVYVPEVDVNEIIKNNPPANNMMSFPVIPNEPIVRNGFFKPIIQEILKSKAILKINASDKPQARALPCSDFFSLDETIDKIGRAHV